MNENGKGFKGKGNLREEFDEEKVREIIEMEFDSLEEWKDVELERVRQEFRNKIYDVNVPLDKDVKQVKQFNDSNEENEYN